MLRVHLFFVKLFGCLIKEHNVAINIAELSTAIVNEVPHQKVFLAVSPYRDGIKKSVGYSNLEADTLHGRVVFAVWLYVLDSFAVRVMYSEPDQKREGLIDAWHPSTITKCIRVTTF